MTSERLTLSAEQIDTIYNNQVKPDFFDDIPPPESRPEAVLIGGQPGAGKSSVLRQLHLPEQRVQVDIDSLRNYVPGYQERARDERLGRDAGDWSHSVARELGKRLRDDTIDAGKNLVYDATLANAESTSRLLDRLDERGYDIQVAMVATHRSLSERGVHERFHSDKQRAANYSKVLPRYVPMSVHGEAYQGLSQTVQRIDQDRHTPAKLTLYEHSKKEIKEIPFTPGRAIEAFDSARENQLVGYEQLREHFQSWNRLSSMMTGADSRATLDEVRETSRTYSGQLERHDWPEPDRFTEASARLTACHDKLEAEAPPYAKEVLDKVRNRVSEQLVQEYAPPTREQFAARHATRHEPSVDDPEPGR